MTNIETLHQEALRLAAEAADKYIKENNYWWPCGFAWAKIKVDGRTKFGKALKKIGFEKSYDGSLSLWNPSGNYTQMMNAKLAGARAYVAHMNKALEGERGSATFYADCRLD